MKDFIPTLKVFVQKAKDEKINVLETLFDTIKKKAPNGKIAPSASAPHVRRSLIRRSDNDHKSFIDKVKEAVGTVFLTIAEIILLPIEIPLLIWFVTAFQSTFLFHPHTCWDDGGMC